MVVRLTPDQKIACSNHVGIMENVFFLPVACTFVAQSPHPMLSLSILVMAPNL